MRDRDRTGRAHPVFSPHHTTCSVFHLSLNFILCEAASCRAKSKGPIFIACFLATSDVGVEEKCKETLESAST